MEIFRKIFKYFSYFSAKYEKCCEALLMNTHIVCFRGEPIHDKSNKTACAPNVDSDPSGHSSVLVRVFAVRMKKAWVLS